MTSYQVTWTNGSQVDRYDTYEEAVAAVRSVLSDPEIGHDGDIASGGERTLFWVDAEHQEDDDGARAAGSIWAMHRLDDGEVR